MKKKTLVILDPTLKKGFTATPNAVLTAPGLSLPAKAIYSILLMFAWQNDECFPGQERLAEVAGCSDRTIRKYLDELRQYGLISWVQRGLNQTNIYYLHDLGEIERFKPLEHKDRKEPSGPERKGSSGQDRKELSDIKRLSLRNVVVEDAPAVENYRNKKTPEVSTTAEPNLIAKLQQKAEEVCGVKIESELLQKLVREHGQEKVKEKIQFLVNAKENAPGLLVDALKKNYTRVIGKISSQQQIARASPWTKQTRSEGSKPDNEVPKKRKEMIQSLYRS